MDAQRILPAALVFSVLALFVGCGASTGYGRYGKSAESVPAEGTPVKTEAATGSGPSHPQPQQAAAAKTGGTKTGTVSKKPPAPAPKPAARKADTRPAVAPAPPAPESTSEPTPEPPVEVSLDNMPLTIDGEWVLDRNEARCSLSSEPLKMEDGQGGTEVTLLLEPGQLLIHTRSAIDLSYSGTGIAIGDQQFSLETVANDTDLSFSKQRTALLAAMRTGNDLKLTVGFWPTWPVTHTYSIDIPLRHFAPAMQAWETCNRLLSGK